MNKIFIIAARALAVALACISVAGTTSAQGLVVSESGQAVFSYPIAVPPGVAGMEPKLSLVYNSGGNNGPIGVGWAVQGMSQITRCPKIEQVVANGTAKPKITPVLYTADDNLCLDGQRLVKVDVSQGLVGQAAASQATPALGVAGGGYVEFRSENDGFSRIRASGLIGGSAAKGPATFTVQTKAGLTQVYGVTSLRGGAEKTDALALSEGGQLPGVGTAWMLKKVVDSVGNAIEFEYDNMARVWGTGPGGVAAAGREWNLKKVMYGCKDSAAVACPKQHQVEFLYETRPDKAEAYHLGSKVVSTLLLKQVLVSIDSGNIPVRNYRMAHVASKATMRQLLESITECAGGGSSPCMPPTRFSYPGITSAGNYVSVSTFNMGFMPLTKFDGSRGTITGDFNGDGKTDLLLWTKNAGNGELNELWLADATVPGKYNKVPSLGDLASVKLGDLLSGYSTTVADINGDGRMDLIRQCRVMGTTSCQGGNRPRMWLSISDNDPANTASYGQFVEIPNPAASVEGPLSSATYNTTNYVCKAWNGVPDAVAPQVESRAQDAFWQDFDGDGRLDLVTFEWVTQSRLPTGCNFTIPPELRVFRYYVGNGAGQFVLKQQAAMTTPLHTLDSSSSAGLSFVESMDVDGDGRPDVLAVNNRWMQGDDGLFREILVGIDPAPLAGTAARMLVVDANGDGKSDVILIDPTEGRTVTSPAPDGATPNQVPANPYEARLFINQGGSFVRDDRPLDEFKKLGKQSYKQGSGLFSNITKARFVAFGSGLTGSMPFDANGDGMSDFMVWSGEDDRHDLRFYASLAGTDAGKTDGGYPALSSLDRGNMGLPEMATGGVTFMSGDFMGVGTPGFIRMQDGGNNNLWYRYGPMLDVMSMVTNVSGVSTWIKYSSTAAASAGLSQSSGDPIGAGLYANSRPPIDLTGISDPQARADKAGKHTWPTHHAHPAQWLVARTDQQSGTIANLLVNTAFSYAGMKSDLSGGGDLGLAAVTKYFPYADGSMMASTTEYLQPLNGDGAFLQEGTQRKQYVGMPKCTYTRVLSWEKNQIPSDGAAKDVVDSRPTRPGGPREQPRGLGGNGQAAGPASGSECFDPTENKPTEGWALQMINMTAYTYCDVQSQGSAASVGWMLPCASTSSVKRPYQYRSVERSWDLADRTKAISTVDTLNTEMTAYGDVGKAKITTTGHNVGGSATQVVTKLTENTYFGATGGANNFITADKWFLGRLATSKVSSSTDAATPLPRNNSGLDATATATQDPALTGTPARLVRPEVLMTIINMLLED